MGKREKGGGEGRKGQGKQKFPMDKKENMGTNHCKHKTLQLYKSYNNEKENKGHKEYKQSINNNKRQQKIHGGFQTSSGVKTEDSLIEDVLVKCVTSGIHKRSLLMERDMGVTKLVSSLWLKQTAFHHALKVTLLACFQLEVSKCRAIAISKSTSLKLLGDWGQEGDREPKKILE